MKPSILKLLVILAILTTMGSCYSLIESAVGDSVAGETEKAITDSGSKADSGSAEISGSAEQAGDAHEIAGTWVNPEYNDEGRSARLVYSPDSDATYTYLAFDRIEGGEVYEGTAEYLKTWIDEEGRSCGQCIVTLRGMSWETLDRISADGSTLEVQSGVREINPKRSRYSIYYRP
jgi:hypothetical protein